MQRKTLGGDRLGSGNKLKVNLHGFERSTHDLGYIWRSTMAAGTLVPFMSQVALPGDTFDINLGCDIMTHPTIGPLFGSYKTQLDVFLAPIRLYNALLHNNSLGIGLKMSTVKLPVIELNALDPTGQAPILDNAQINPSCLLSYLGIRGVGMQNVSPAAPVPRTFNATAILAYWEIYKQYYANKQEEIGAVIHTPSEAIITSVSSITISQPPSTTYTIPQSPSTAAAVITLSAVITIHYTTTPPIPEQIIFNTTELGDISADQLVATPFVDDAISTLVAPYWGTNYGTITVINWRYKTDTDSNTGKPKIATFPLENIDEMRKIILNNWNPGNALVINNTDLEPYKWLAEAPNDIPNMLSNQEGLALKTYQSDLLNNWLQTEWIDGAGGITEITSIDTSGGSFSIDTLNLSKKVYDMLNRIAVSGGTYDDWVSAVYDHSPYTRCESPIYCGGLIKELVFQEVVSNSASESQPLGTLAGKGTMAAKHKGGSITIKVDEPSYIIGIISLTPRLDYSQGNTWDVNLQTLDDLHKPSLDEIGFQELITEQMAWWTTEWNETDAKWEQKSAGKQPAWLNYMTNINRTYGNFAIQDNEMFMTLNRRYEFEDSANIKDLTTYIDPSKFNFIFAETSLDAQNFWAQISVDITARRKMSAKLMPNV